ncbi:MAG: histidinol-phosphate transaminase [Bdellovibrionia bacterium]
MRNGVGEMVHVPQHIRALVPYVPGKPIEETQREYQLKQVIKLASNENPLGASPKARQASKKALSELHRYPDGSGYHLKSALMKKLTASGVFAGRAEEFYSRFSIILGNGSNDVIEQVIRTFCVPGDAIVTSQKAFIAYSISAQIHGVKTLEVPLDEHLRFDPSEMVDWVRRNEKVRVVFLANPNNPTGTYLNHSELQQLVRGLSQVRDGSVILVLDYAYWEYMSAPDLADPLEFLGQYPNTLILRTFSKIYGLAGFRVGYGLGPKELMAHLEKVRQPFNMNSPALAGAQAALEDDEFVRKSIEMNQKGMQFWEKQLKKMSIPFWKSQGNFLLLDVQSGFGLSGIELNQRCLPCGLILRPLANYGMPGQIRLTVGSSFENQKAAQILRDIQASASQRLRQS